MPSSLVLVTEPEFRRAEAVFTSRTDLQCVVAPADEAGLAAAIAQAGARFVVIGHLHYRDQLYEAMPRGGVLARFGVGHDGVDKAAATRAGVLCTNTPAVLNQSVAELTLLLILAAARHLTAIAGDFASGTWAPRQGTEIRGKTLAIVGCGRIGQATARIARDGFGMRVVGLHHRASTDDLAGEFDTVTNEFREAVEDADFVSVHIPATPGNANFINRERLGYCAPRAWLINTARGSVLDEAALYDVLADRRIAGAALDVFAREPYEPVPGHDLRTLSNVILIPHVGTNTVDANRRMAERALHNILLAEAGNFAAMDLLNPDVLRGLPGV